MGGSGSGGRGRALTLDDCFVINLPNLMGRGAIRHGQIGSGSISWQAGLSVEYSYNLSDPPNAELRLSAPCGGAGHAGQRAEQRIRLTLTSSMFGGVRWWLQCPQTGRRATKLYRPPGCTIFASRHHWDLGYQSQREPRHLVPFARLDRLQRRMGLPSWPEMPLYRPKGMWRRTFARHAAEGIPLSRHCRKQIERVDAQIRSFD